MDLHNKSSSSVSNDRTETTSPVISLKVMLDKRTNKVVFAECEKEFVDILFSFLTMPIGTIISLIGEKSPTSVIGCMNNLYKSVKNLENRLLRTKACKEMLLRPRTSAEDRCKMLKLRIDDDKERNNYYFCKDLNCRSEKRGLVSEFQGVRCHCGETMKRKATLRESKTDMVSFDEEGVFVHSGMDKFIITDDLQVLPASTSTTAISLLKNLGIIDVSGLESLTVDIGEEEIVQLLRFSLLSKTPLTHLISLKRGDIDFREFEQTYKGPQRLSGIVRSNRKMSIKLIISKQKKHVLYAECKEDFVDFLFSFLTFPLGSVAKLLHGKSLLGCADNLFKSVKNLSTDENVLSEEVKNMLESPKLAPNFACDNQLFEIEESSLPQYHLFKVFGQSNWFLRPQSTHSTSIKSQDLMSIVNPKSSTGETTSGGGFVKGPATYMITNDLVVTQLSPISAISMLGEFNVHVTEVDETVVGIGEEEALELLQASLISKTALTDFFKTSAQGVHYLAN